MSLHSSGMDCRRAHAAGRNATALVHTAAYTPVHTSFKQAPWPLLHCAVAVALTLAGCLPAHAASPSDSAAALAEMRRQVQEMRDQYEARLKALEDKLNQAQRNASANATADSAAARSASMPSATAAASTDNAGGSSAVAAGGDNAFNPAVSVILSGLYAGLSKDPGTWHMSGFLPSGEEVGPGKRGFSLSESELSLAANIDPWFRGALTLSVSGDDTISAEEAFVQTTSLPNGLRVKAGRFFSGLGYLNEQHSHTWDFVDAPLAYQAFLGGQYRQEGVQAAWLLPTDQFVELGAELGNGASFPGSDRNRNGAGSVAVFAHTGGDVGDSNSWRAGLSWMRTQAADRLGDQTDAQGQQVTNAFTGQSRIWAVDGVWKWAPNGNGKVTNFKLQGEYFRRIESGQLTYAFADPEGLGLTPNTDAYRSAQSGWYVQGIYQFTTGWRVGVRHDALDSGNVDYGNNAANFIATGYKPRRESVMLDWSPSEFSRWRLQLSDDRAREGVKDRQLFLQYQMSLGAHGAHSY